MEIDFDKVIRRLGARPDREDRNLGTLEVSPAVTTHGLVQPSILMLLADTIVGMRNEMATEDWLFTTDFSLRMATTTPVDQIVAHVETLRRGRRLIVDAVEMTDPSGAPVAHAQITFMVTPAPEGTTKPDFDELLDDMRRDRQPLEQSFTQACGVDIVDPATGRVQLMPADHILRPGAMVLGPVMTLLGEVSAHTLAEHHFAKPCVVVDLDARYLLGGRTGPLVAEAAWVGPPDRGVIRVAGRDLGHEGAITTSFLCRVEPLAG